MKKLYSIFTTLLLLCLLLSGCGAAKQVKEDASDIKIPCDSQELYAFQCLDEKEQKVYNSMEYALNNHIDTIRVDTLDDDSMRKVFSFVLKDHPEIFWCSSYNRKSTKYSDGTVKTDFEPIYTMSKSERYDLKEKIDKVTDSWLASVPSGASDYDKVKIVFNLLVTEVDYVSDSENNQNIVSVFVNKETVCQGYSKAFQYLLGKLGISSTLVIGNAEGGPHSWNLVLLDGDYYYIDVTWGNPSFSSKEAENLEKGFINYAYFCVTTEELLKSHTIEDQLTVPKCTATKDNYFVKEGLMFTEANKNIVGDAIYNASIDNKKFVSMKFSNAELYEWAVNYFITEKHIFDFSVNTTKHYVYQNQELLVLSIIFT